MEFVGTAAIQSMTLRSIERTSLSRNNVISSAFQRKSKVGKTDMPSDIITLDAENFNKCKNIWDMDRQVLFAQTLYNELAKGNRITYVYQKAGDYVGEISLVLEMNDPEYTIKNRRIYVSRLIVKPCERRKGIGRALLHHAIEQARKMSFAEMSVGVDLKNYPALKLYVAAGFSQIIFVGEDEQGKYIKLLKYN